MGHRPFVMWPHKILRTPAQNVVAVSDDILAIWDEMTIAMEKMPGVGLAAVQLGIPLRLAVVDASNTRGQVVKMANPEVIHASIEPRNHDEASPNFPGVSAKITRPRAVTVRFLNTDNETEERDFVGLWATSVQHQIDHLNGKMYFDNLSKVKRDMLLRKAKKLRG